MPKHPRNSGPRTKARPSTPRSSEEALTDIDLPKKALDCLSESNKERLALHLASVLRGTELSLQEQNQIVDAVGRALERCARETSTVRLPALGLALLDTTGVSGRACGTISWFASLLNRS